MSKPEKQEVQTGAKKPRRDRGQPEKITPELVARICQLLRDGNYRQPAAKACGISLRSFYNWIRLGKEQDKGPYHDFLQALIKAENDAEVSAVKIFREAMQGDPDYAIRWLEKKHPQRWGRNRDKVHELEKNIAAMERQVETLSQLVETMTATRSTHS